MSLRLYLFGKLRTCLFVFLLLSIVFFVILIEHYLEQMNLRVHGVFREVTSKIHGGTSSEDSGRYDEMISYICTLVQSMNRANSLERLESELQQSTSHTTDSQWISVLGAMKSLSSSCNLTRGGAPTFTNTLTSGNDNAKDHTRRPDHCTGCFKHNFQYVINNENICKQEPMVDLLVLISTSLPNLEARVAMRETWLTYTVKNTARIRYAFLLGKTDNQVNMETIKQENEKYGDILQEDFVDSYQNLTYKTIMGFRWATNHCSNAKFVMKTDDDVWVNIPHLLLVLQREHVELQTSLGGYCLLESAPHRDKSSKWYVPYLSYPHDTYPGFCSGTGYVTSLSVATKIFNISKEIPFFYLEDIFVALCLRELRLNLKPIAGFNNYKVDAPFCQYKRPHVLTSHEMTPYHLHAVWNATCDMDMDTYSYFLNEYTLKNLSVDFHSFIRSERCL